MTTLENNKLIAEFMGIVFTKDNKANHPRIKAPYPPIECFNYHLDWNWLMEVVEKIIGLKNVYGEKRQKVFKAINPNKEITYNACVEFIKWYNEQKEA